MNLQARNKRLFFIIALSAALAACAASPTTPPVVEDAGAPIERETSTDTDTSKTPETGQVAAAAPPTAATASLLAAAQTASEARNFADAISYLERAVRIEPRNATLWIELSDAHLANGNTNAANQHVRKAIALAGTDAALTRLAWLQLANVREAEGNLSEARAIRRRYAGLRG